MTSPNLKSIAFAGNNPQILHSYNFIEPRPSQCSPFPTKSIDNFCAFTRHWFFTPGEVRQNRLYEELLPLQLKKELLKLDDLSNEGAPLAQGSVIFHKIESENIPGASTGLGILNFLTLGLFSPFACSEPRSVHTSFLPHHGEIQIRTDLNGDAEN